MLRDSQKLDTFLNIGKVYWRPHLLNTKLDNEAGLIYNIENR